MTVSVSGSVSVSVSVAGSVVVTVTVTVTPSERPGGGSRGVHRSCFTSVTAAVKGRSATGLRPAPPLTATAPEAVATA